MFSSERWRGAWLSLFSLMVGVGILLVYTAGAGLYWRYTATLPLAVYLLLAAGVPSSHPGEPLLHISVSAGLLFVPESPIWLLGHKGEEEAARALRWLRSGEGRTSRYLNKILNIY